MSEASPTPAPSAVASAPAATEPKAVSEKPEAKASSEAVVPEVPSKPSSLRKIKYGSKEREIDLIKDADEAVELIQKGWASGETFRQTAEKEKKLQAFINAIGEGDFSALEKIAKPEMIRKFAEQHLLKHIEWEALPENEQNLIKAEKRATDAETRAKKYEDREAADARGKTVQKAHEDIDLQVTDAFKTQGVPMTPRRIMRVAEYMDASLSDEDGTLLDAGKALGKVADDLRSDTVEVLESMTGEQLLEFLPKKTLDAIRKAMLAEAQGTQPFAPNRRQSNSDTPRKPTTKAIRQSTDSFFEQLEKRLG